MCRESRAPGSPRRARFAPALLLAALLPAALLAAAAPVAAREQPAGRIAALQAHVAALPPETRDALARRAAAWDALTPAERADRREAWLAWQALPPADRDALRMAAARFAALDPAERASLRARWDSLDALDRHGWSLGPVLGSAWPHLHALFAQVPDAERGPLLQALHALPPQAVADLAVLAQRTPPQDRDALRRTLLSTPADARAAWLRRRVDP